MLQLFGEHAFLGHYARHPDPKQEKFFFDMVRGCLQDGVVTEAQLRDEIQKLRDRLLQV